jgi:hypothetical protein
MRFELVIMIEVAIEGRHGTGFLPDVKLIASEPWLDRHTFNDSEMARSSDHRDAYAQNVLDTADIVREAISRQVCR